MKLYLVQHGEAVTKEIDPDRPLSVQGKQDVILIATTLKHAGITIEKILHSGKTRARQTAEILADTLLVGKNIEAINGIAPNDPIDTLVKTLLEFKTNTMIVGHLPYMAKLVAYLVTGNTEKTMVTFHPGSIVCLEQIDQQTWLIQWMIRPDCIQNEGEQ